MAEPWEAFTLFSIFDPVGIVVLAGPSGDSGTKEDTILYG